MTENRTNAQLLQQANAFLQQEQFGASPEVKNEKKSLIPAMPNNRQIVDLVELADTEYKDTIEYYAYISGHGDVTEQHAHSFKIEELDRIGSQLDPPYGPIDVKAALNGSASDIKLLLRLVSQLLRYHPDFGLMTHKMKCYSCGKAKHSVTHNFETYLDRRPQVFLVDYPLVVCTSKQCETQNTIVSLFLSVSLHLWYIIYVCIWS